MMLCIFTMMNVMLSGSRKGGKCNRYISARIAAEKAKLEFIKEYEKLLEKVEKAEKALMDAEASQTGEVSHIFKKLSCHRKYTNLNAKTMSSYAKNLIRKKISLKCAKAFSHVSENVIRFQFLHHFVTKNVFYDFHLLCIILNEAKKRGKLILCQGT